MVTAGVVTLVAVAALWVRPRAVAPAAPIIFRDVTAESGITFRHTDGSGGRRYIVESVSAGLALFDYDNDGDEDIYFLNGAPLRGTQLDYTPRNALYRNDGQWHFSDVTEQAGVGDTGYGLGVTVGDYDNDGDLDLYINNFGPNVLYRNNGDGTFTDVTAQAGVANGNKVGAGTCFLDIEGDGDLDLYVANYVDFTYENHVPCSVNGLPAYAGPRDYNPVPDTLYRNNGDGTFTDISHQAGIAACAGTGMGMVCADYDNDGDTDIFVCNDIRRNFLFLNDGTGHFEEMGLLVGAAYNYYGNENASMGVDCGDYNNDGRLDFFVTDYQGELPVLYENVGNGLLDDVTRRTGAGLGTYQHVTWGAGLVDFDNDGDRDLFVPCGHIQDNIHLRDQTTSYYAENVLLQNLLSESGEARFVDISRQAGNGLRVRLASRGAAFADLDNDGDQDVVVLNIRREPTLLRNDTVNNNHWVQIHLRGRESNRFGVGARVRLVAGTLSLVDEVHSGRSYQSHYGLRLHFGLGTENHIDFVEVRWPTGKRERFFHVPVDQIVTLVEGEGELEESHDR